MTEPLNKVQRGDPMRIPASTFNMFVDAARHFRAQQHSSGPQAIAHQGARSPVIVYVKNSSGADRGRFDVLGVDGIVFTPTDNLDTFVNDHPLVGVVPTKDAHTGKFAVLSEPVRSNEIGRACICGVTPVRVNLTDDDHTWADVANANADRLESRLVGSAEILWKESGTGEVWALVSLGHAVAESGFWAEITEHGGVGDEGAHGWEERVPNGAGGWKTPSSPRAASATDDDRAYESDGRQKVPFGEKVFITIHDGQHVFEADQGGASGGAPKLLSGTGEGPDTGTDQQFARTSQDTGTPYRGFVSTDVTRAEPLDSVGYSHGNVRNDVPDVRSPVAMFTRDYVGDAAGHINVVNAEAWLRANAGYELLIYDRLVGVTWADQWTGTLQEKLIVHPDQNPDPGAPGDPPDRADSGGWLQLDVAAGSIGEAYRIAHMPGDVTDQVHPAQTFQTDGGFDLDATINGDEETVTVKFKQWVAYYDRCHHLIGTSDSELPTDDLSFVNRDPWLALSYEPGAVFIAHVGPDDATIYTDDAVRSATITGENGQTSGAVVTLQNGNIQFDLRGHRCDAEQTTLKTVSVPQILNDLADASAASPSDKQILIYNSAAGQWVNGIGEAVTVLTDVRTSGLELQKRTRQVWVIKADAESSWAAWHTGTQCD